MIIMITKKQREDMLEEAAKAMADNNGEPWGQYIREAFMNDAQACLKIFEPILMAEVQAEYNRLKEEMDRLVDENEYLTEILEKTDTDF